MQESPWRDCGNDLLVNRQIRADGQGVSVLREGFQVNLDRFHRIVKGLLFSRAVHVQALEGRGVCVERAVLISLHDDGDFQGEVFLCAE